MANKLDPILGEYRQDDFTSLAFTELSDVPASYTSQALKALRVNSAATALEFYTPTDANDAAVWGNLTGTLSAQTDLQNELNAKADALTADQNYVSDAQLVVIGNTSGTNTGDQTLPTRNSLGIDTDDTVTFAGVLLSGLTASQIVITDASKNLVSAAIATYPSLTELTYLKGVTSAIQTQIDSKAAHATTITIAGTANQITSSAGAQDLSANRTWTLSLPADVLIPTVLTVPNTGLHLLDTNASHDLILKPGSDLTADKTLTLTTGDTDVILNLTAVTDGFVLTYDTGTNSWRGEAGGSGTPTAITVADEATDITCFPLFVTAATGDLGPKTNAGLAFNSNTGLLTATGFSGPLTGNVTGNVSGTAATVTGATQAAITSAANLATVGTIGTGVWQGTTIKANYLQQAAADLGDADITVDFTNSNVGNVTNLIIDGALTIASFGGNWTNAGRTVADAGILTTVDINGGTIDGVIIGGASAAAATVTTLGAGAITSTGLLSVTLAGNTADFKNTTDNASVQVAILEGDRATMADNDEAYITLRLSDDGGTQKEVARLTWVATDVNAGTSVDGRLDFSVMTAGTLAKELQLDGTALSPTTTDGLSLGTTLLNFSDLFLDSGAVIDFDGGDMVLTHTLNTLTFTGGTVALGTATATGGLTGNVTGDVSGSAATVTGAAQAAITSLGTLTTLTVDNILINGNDISSTAGTDLTITPLAGQQIVLDGTIVIDAGVVTGATSITSTDFVGALTGTASGNLVSGGALGTPSSGTGTNITGIPAANILAGSFGAGAYVISTSLQAATIELGHATDTTLARVSAGVVSIEGNNIYTVGGTDVSVADGGTGVSTLGDAGVLIGNGTGAVAVTSAGTSGQVLTSNGAGVDPTFQAAGGVAEDVIKTITVSLSAANIIAMFTTPVEIIPAPSAGKVLVVDELVFSFTVGGTQFTAGGVVRLQYNGGTINIFGNASNNGITATSVNGAASFIAIRRTGAGSGIPVDGGSATSVVITNATAAFATGNGTAKVFVKYRILTL